MAGLFSVHRPAFDLLKMQKTSSHLHAMPTPLSHYQLPHSIGVTMSLLRVVLVFSGLWFGLLSHTHAMPPSYTVPRQRAVIVAIKDANPKEGTLASLEVRCIGINPKSAILNYTLSFTDDSKITAVSRSRGRQVITFQQLRVGHEVVFSGRAVASWLVLNRNQYTVFIP